MRGPQNVRGRSDIQRVFGSLPFRILALLSLALLPVGLIAVNQTKRVADIARENAELLLLTRTEKASFGERIVIEQARGAARLLGSLQQELDEPGQCEEYLRAFLSANSRFSFIGVLPKSGVMECSSSGSLFDFSSFSNFEPLMSAERASVTVNQAAPLSGKSVIIVSEPYYELGAFQGMISVSVPHERLAQREPDAGFDDLMNVITFNAQGDILTATGPLGSAHLDTPMASQMADLIRQGAYSFSGQDKLGQARIFSVVPIIEGTVYTLGVWATDTQAAQRYLNQLPPWIFPALMWGVSLAVALFAVHRLVIRHVRRLGRLMRDFAKTRALPSERDEVIAAVELAEMEDDFHEMARVILQDEASLENNLRDKNVLLKEVHHRVKNNLQLISSIMNMQIRRARSPETKEVIGRLQDRVLGLATIHRDLYQSQSGGRVNAGNLVREIVTKALELAEDRDEPVTPHIDIEDVMLFPDQAVPLSLLMSEATTNAMKYLGPDKQGKCWIRASLETQGDTVCIIRFANSVAGETAAESTGLGAQLINAFTLQLGGEMDITETEDSYMMELTFQIAAFTNEAADY